MQVSFGGRLLSQEYLQRLLVARPCSLGKFLTYVHALQWIAGLFHNPFRLHCQQNHNIEACQSYSITRYSLFAVESALCMYMVMYSRDFVPYELAFCVTIQTMNGPYLAVIPRRLLLSSYLCLTFPLSVDMLLDTTRHDQFVGFPSY
jgi:hypothetical protein